MDGHTQVIVWVEDGVKAAMDDVKTRSGKPLAAQIRFAVTEWLEREHPDSAKLIASSDR